MNSQQKISDMGVGGEALFLGLPFTAKWGGGTVVERRGTSSVRPNGTDVTREYGEGGIGLFASCW